MSKRTHHDTTSGDSDELLEFLEVIDGQPQRKKAAVSAQLVADDGDEEMTLVENSEASHLPLESLSLVEQDENYLQNKLLEFLARKRVEAVSKEVHFRNLTRHALSGHVKLLILEFLQHNLVVNDNFDNSCRQMIGRFVGDSDRKFVLVFRSLLLQVNGELFQKIQQRNEFLKFVLKQTHFISINVAYPTSAERLSSLFEVASNLMHQVKAIRCINATSSFDNVYFHSQDKFFSKVVEWTLGQSSLALASKMPRLLKLDLPKRGLSNADFAMLPTLSVPYVVAIAPSVQLAHALIRNTAIQELRLSGVRDAIRLPSDLQLSHLRRFECDRTIDQVDRVARFSSAKMLSFWHIEGALSLAGISSLQHLCTLHLGYNDLQPCNEELLFCPQLSNFSLTAVTDSLSHRTAWIQRLLQPMARSGKLYSLAVSLPGTSSEEILSLCPRDTSLRKIAFHCISVSTQLFVQLLWNERIRSIFVIEGVDPQLAEQFSHLGPSQWEWKYQHKSLSIQKNIF